MSDRVTRLGVLGAGQYFATAYLPYLMEGPSGLKVAALCRRNREELQRLGAHFPAATLYGEGADLLTHEPMDAVLISTPHHLHYSQVKQALQRELHVLVDKPLCLDAAQAEELVLLAQEKERILTIAYSYHYWSHFQKARQLVASGALGKITSVACLGAASATTSPVLDPSSWYQDVEQSGGGSLASGGTHRVEAILWLTGLRPQRIYASMRGPQVGLDYQASLTLELEGGVVASLLNEAQGPTWRLELSIYGKQGALFIRNHELEHVDHMGQIQELSCWPPETNAVADFIRAIAQGYPSLADGECAYWAVAAIQAAYASARTERAVRVRPFSNTKERDGEAR